MATTVTYKGQTLATVENQTKTLQTAGTWVEDDFTLTDVTQGGSGMDADDLAVRNYTGDIVLDSATYVAFYAFQYSDITSVTSNTVTTINNYGFASCKELLTADFPNLTGSINSYTFDGCTKLVSVNLPNANQMVGYNFRNCTSLTEVMLPGLAKTGNSATGSDAFRNCISLETVDLGKCVRIDGNCFNGDSVLDTLILRKTSVCALANVNAFTGTPFASGSTGGTVYVPQALIGSYQTASNWSTLYSAGTCNFVAIEGSEYE